MTRVMALCSLLLLASGCVANPTPPPTPIQTPTSASTETKAEDRTSEAAEFALSLTWSNQLVNPSRSQLVSAVISRGGFTRAEAEAGVDSRGLDWNRNAADRAMKKVSFYPNRLDLMDSLLRDGFTQAEAEAGLALIGCIQMRCDGG